MTRTTAAVFPFQSERTPSSLAISPKSCSIPANDRFVDDT
jgi:hypothetical protein